MTIPVPHLIMANNDLLTRSSRQGQREVQQAGRNSDAAIAEMELAQSLNEWPTCGEISQNKSCTTCRFSFFRSTLSTLGLLDEVTDIRAFYLVNKHS